MKNTVNTPYKTIRASISYHSNEHIELPDMAIIELSNEDIDKIKLAKSQVKEHGFESISIPVSSKLMEEGEESEFRSECDRLRITSYGIYFYAQNKYDGSAQIESESIELLTNLTTNTTHAEICN